MCRITAVAVVLIIIISVAAPVTAGDADAGVTVPGSARYLVQRLVERVRLGLTRDPGARASLIAQMIQRRASEIEAMNQEQQSRFAPGLAGNMAALVRAAERIMSRMHDSGADMTGVAAAVASSSTRALDVLQQLQESGHMPVQAEAGLLQAARSLERTQSRSCEILERIADGEMPGNRARALREIQSMRKTREDLPAPARGRPAPGGE